MEQNVTSSPHSVMRWQPRGTDRDAQRVRSLRSETLFSTWTPLNDKTSNLQLFEERTRLVLHWFDLWSDAQRRHLLTSLLQRCSGSQLRCCRDLLMDAVPVARADFTAVLPRFLSLYVMSFLSPRDLAAAAQVSWTWRILAEQDCLWAGRCTIRGWFLPYAPAEKEYGAWRSHYVSCLSALDRLRLREGAPRDGTLSRQNIGPTEEEERRKERRIRQMVKEKLQEEKRDSLRTRRAWGSSLKPGGARGTGGGGGAAAAGGGGGAGGGAHSGRPSSGQTSWTSRQSRLDKPSASLTTFTSRPASPHTDPPIHLPHPPLLLLVSDRIPAYELLLSGVKAGVTVVLYDHRGPLSALLTQAQRAVCGQRAQRLGLLAPGGTEEIQLLHNSSLTDGALRTPDHRAFWEKLRGCVAPAEEGGGLDVFSPLAASATGAALIQTLSALTGLEVRAPMGLATGSFQNILSEWSDGGAGPGLWDQLPTSPALQYVSEGVLQAWCRQAQWMEEALGELRALLGPRLQRVGLQARGRALGHLLWEEMRLEELCVSTDLSRALIEGLAALTREEDSARPVEFLAGFLTRWAEKEDGGGADFSSEPGAPEDLSRKAQPPQVCELRLQAAFDWRAAVARELLHSERVYLGRLGAVLQVYQEPLAAALGSGRPILSGPEIQIILGPVAQILELHRVFQVDLHTRLQQWAADQCVGDVFLKLCFKLRVYSSYLNNYNTAVQAIDRCREAKPSFRAFLKRSDRTLPTNMLSLQELLLCPVWRIQEYVTLLQALTVHTHPGHPDHTHLSSALGTLLRFRELVQKLKRNSERDQLMEETQQMIQGCPNLQEGNRQLITTQDAALLRSPDEQIPESLRIYEQACDVGLFLFNDALVLTRRLVHHTPFTPALRYSHTFLASVALAGLAVREITHSRYVSHAFVLEGPRRSWVCATGGEEEREHFLSALRSAISCALIGRQ